MHTRQLNATDPFIQHARSSVVAVFTGKRYASLINIKEMPVLHADRAPVLGASLQARGQKLQQRNQRAESLACQWRSACIIHIILPLMFGGKQMPPSNCAWCA